MALFSPDGITRVATYTNAAFEAVLKESYAPKVYEQLNNEVFVLSVMEKKKAQWSGKTAVIPLHIGRNTSVRWADEGAGAIIAAGTAIDNQDWAKLHVDVKYVYGFFGFTGQAMEVCKGKDAIVDACEQEMSKLKDDIKNECDQRMFAGRRVLGFINERKTGIANDTWEFSGDVQRAASLLATANAAGENLTVNLVRMDDYTTLGNGNGAILNITVTTVNLTGGLLTFQQAVDTTPGNWVGAGNAGSPVALPDGVGIAVVVVGGNAVTADVRMRPHGIFDNLAEPMLYQLNRRSKFNFAAGNRDDNAAGNASPFSIAGGGTSDAIEETHAIILTNNPGGTHGRTSMNPTRLQMLEDELQFLSGSKYDEIVMSPLMQSEYVNLGNQTASLVTSSEAAKKLDLGFSGMSFNGVEIKTARNCPRGLMLFLTKDTWGFYELCPLKFSDRGNGAILEPVARADYYEGMMKWYYNLACTAPKKNAILVGIDYPGATVLP